jgi:uncharacterized damage-inducible protein DinB
MEPPQFPAGEYRPETNYGDVRRAVLIDEIEGAPMNVRQAVAGLDESQLDTKYRNWSIRQIVQHLADSHANCYVRFKWALTENQPLIKAYDETRWSELPDARTGNVDAPLALLAGVHACWSQLLREMTPAEFQRGFIHPETGKLVLLADALPTYAWHCRHHTGQILWIRAQRAW